MICLRCRNRLDPVRVAMEQDVGAEQAQALESIAAEMKRLYPIVIYCKALKSIVVGNPAKRAQSVTECQYYEEAE